MGGASILSGYLQGDAAKDAADTSAAASRYAADLVDKQYQQTRSDLAPYREAGTDALDIYTGYGQSKVAPGDYLKDSYDLEFDLYQDPSYQFRVGEQERAINRNSAGYGNLLSGNRLEEIMARSGELASQEYANAYGRAVGERNFAYKSDIDRYNLEYGQESDYLNRLYGIVGSGQNAAAQTGAFGANAANTSGRLIAQAGDAQAAGQVGAANAYSNAIGGISNAVGMYMGYNAYNQPINLSNPGYSYDPNSRMQTALPWN
jgi:hypothetical protein